MSNYNHLRLQTHLTQIHSFFKPSQAITKEIGPNESETLVLQIDSVLLRQNLSRELHLRYGFDTFTADFNLDPGDYEFKITKLKDAEVIFEPKEFKKCSLIENSKFEMADSRVLKEIKTNPKAIELEAMLKTEVESLYEYELGFSRVIEVMIASKKPLIGHNLFLDI